MVLRNVITPQGLEPFQFSTKFGTPSGAGLQPYLVAAAGVQHSRSRFPGALQEQFSSNAFTANGGVGTRIRLWNRFSISPEFRLGGEPIMRATVSLGYTFR